MDNGPDFIIAGAMKCGTTWLHETLNSIDGVGIPAEEIHWIDAHDPIAHPDFQKVCRSGLRLQDGRKTRWFQEEYPESRMPNFGYDATTLFHSHIDLNALAEAMPKVKIIVLLRNPVSRAYSHYWHLVRTGRARFGFETEILRGRQEILHCSIYEAPSRRMVNAFGDRIHFVCYERIFAEPECELRAIVDFLNLPSDSVTQMLGYLDRFSNAARYPRFLRGWLLGSRLLSGLELGRYADYLGSRDFVTKVRSLGYWLKISIMVTLSLGLRRSPYKLSTQTAVALTDYFQEANRGLDDITGRSFSRFWCQK